jgi:hypothetical protein
MFMPEKEMPVEKDPAASMVSIACFCFVPSWSDDN